MMRCSSALPVLVELARRGALLRVVEDLRELALQLPGVEEEGPVDELRELGEVDAVERAAAEERGLRERRGAEVERGRRARASA